MKKPLPTTLLLLLCLAILASGALAAAGIISLPISRPTSGGTARDGGYYLASAAGQHDAGTLSGGGYRLNGGVLGELFTGHIPEDLGRVHFLPLVARHILYTLTESEPNNYFYQANRVPGLPVKVLGSFDGVSESGDLFAVELQAGQVLSATLETENSLGVQLLAYNPQGEEITRDFAPPFRISFTTASSGDHYLYAYSSAEAGNNAPYQLFARLAGSIYIAPIELPAVDPAWRERAPQVEP